MSQVNLVQKAHQQHQIKQRTQQGGSNPRLIHTAFRFQNLLTWIESIYYRLRPLFPFPYMIGRGSRSNKQQTGLSSTESTDRFLPHLPPPLTLDKSINQLQSDGTKKRYETRQAEAS